MESGILKSWQQKKYKTLNHGHQQTSAVKNMNSMLYGS